MIKLTDLLDIDIENNLTVSEQIESVTFDYLCEVTDINNVYPYKSSEGFVATFQDNNNIQHFIRIVYQPLRQPRYDLKFGFFDEKGKPSYDRPNLHYNLHPDEKIYNTHLSILLQQFLEKDDFFGKANIDKLYLPAIDHLRYRLFRKSINKFLDKNKYKMYDDPEHKNTLIIEPLPTPTKPTV